MQTRTPPTTTSTPTPIPTPPPHPVSIEALAQQAYDGRNLQIGEVLDANDAYTRYFVTYASGDLTISGIMNIPVGAEPFPTLVLAHGYIDPAIYTNGRGRCGSRTTSRGPGTRFCTPTTATTPSPATTPTPSSSYASATPRT